MVFGRFGWGGFVGFFGPPGPGRAGRRRWLPPVPADDPYSTSVAESSVAGYSESDDDDGRPVAQLRRTLAQSRGSAASPASPVAESSPPPPVPTVDLRDLRPQTSKEVVDLAVRHLGLDREEVVARAKAMLPASTPRNVETLAPVWLALVDSAESPSDPVKDHQPPVPEPELAAPVPGPGPPVPEPVPGPGPPVPEPSESEPPDPAAPEPEPLELQEPPGPEPEPPESPEKLVAQFKEAFPGAELVIVDEDDPR